MSESHASSWLANFICVPDNFRNGWRHFLCFKDSWFSRIHLEFTVLSKHWITGLVLCYALCSDIIFGKHWWLWFLLTTIAFVVQKQHQFDRVLAASSCAELQNVLPRLRKLPISVHCLFALTQVQSIASLFLNAVRTLSKTRHMTEIQRSGHPSAPVPHPYTISYIIWSQWIIISRVPKAFVVCLLSSKGI